MRIQKAKFITGNEIEHRKREKIRLKNGGYFLDYGVKPIEFAELSTDEIFSLKSFSAVFPSYNEEVHCIEMISYLGYERDKYLLALCELDEGEIEIPFGIYDASLIDHNPALTRASTRTDVQNLFAPTFDLLKDYQDFINKPNPGRRGILLYGEPGNGKTQSILRLTNEIKDKAIILFVKSFEAVEAFREQLSKKPVVFIFEDVQGLLQSRFETLLLDLLDGQKSYNCSYTIATTNNPEQLDQNLVSRPGRFAKCIEFKAPDKPIIIDFLTKKYRDFVYSSDFGKLISGLSWDHLTAVTKNSETIEEFIINLKQHKQDFEKLSKIFKQGIGFNQ